MGFNQEQLSAKAGIHRAYLSDVERGLRNITLAVLDRIANALQISISDLLKESEGLRDVSQAANSVVVETQDLAAMFINLRNQLDEMVKHAEQFQSQQRPLVDKSTRKAGRVPKAKTSNQSSSVEESSRSSKLNFEVEKERFVTHREKFLDARDQAVVPKSSSKRKKRT